MADHLTWHQIYITVISSSYQHSKETLHYYCHNFQQNMQNMRHDERKLHSDIRSFNAVASPGFCAQEGHGMHIHEIRQKFLHKYNKLTLTQLKRL